jgi:hypothetical protein
MSPFKVKPGFPVEEPVNRSSEPFPQAKSNVAEMPEQKRVGMGLLMMVQP